MIELITEEEDDDGREKGDHEGDDDKEEVDHEEVKTKERTNPSYLVLYNIQCTSRTQAVTQPEIYLKKHEGTNQKC